MPRSLADWLEYIERQHPKAIDLGLERVNEVRGRLGTVLSCPILAVGGTNGKGSTCAMLEAVLRAAGYRTALYMSPHLMRYNERVRTCGEEASDPVVWFEDREIREQINQAQATLDPLDLFGLVTVNGAFAFKKVRARTRKVECLLRGDEFCGYVVEWDE